jgi:hypothetical protein
MTGDPLDSQSGVFELPMTPTAIVDAFEMAASSFAVNHGLPNATFYRPPSSPPSASCHPPAPDQGPTFQPKVPNPTVSYPPPLPDDSDPDRLRLLHSWYWAGYYTGLADGKRSSKQ